MIGFLVRVHIMQLPLVSTRRHVTPATATATKYRVSTPLPWVSRAGYHIGDTLNAKDVTLLSSLALGAVARRSHRQPSLKKAQAYGWRLACLCQPSSNADVGTEALFGATSGQEGDAELTSDQQREATWQEAQGLNLMDQVPEPEPLTVEEELGSAVVAFVPIVGPLALTWWYASKGRLGSAFISFVSCLVDVSIWGGGGFLAHMHTTQKLHKHGGAVIGHVLSKKGSHQAGYLLKFAPNADPKVIQSVMQKASAASAKTLSKSVAKHASTQVVKRGLQQLFAQTLSTQIETYIKNPALFEGQLGDVALRDIPGTAVGPRLSASEAAGDVVLPRDKIPLRSLRGSNFLALYDLCPKKPSKRDVMAPMTKTVRDAYDECFKRRKGNLYAASVQLWTEKLVYKAVNAALISDNAGLLAHWMPFVRSLNNYLVRYHPQGALIARRMSFLTTDRAYELQEGQIYRLGMFVASSKETWEAFPSGVGGQQVRIEFHVPDGCFQAADIEALSAFENEREILLVPYTAVRVTKVFSGGEGQAVTIRMEVLKDSKAAPLDLETILA